MGDSLLELSDLDSNNSISLCIANTISKDHEVCGQVSVMMILERLHSQLESILELSINELLALSLYKILRVVLSHCSIRRCRESNDRGRSSVADIDTNQHGALGFHGIWELHLVEVASNLAVDLAKYI